MGERHRRIHVDRFMPAFSFRSIQSRRGLDVPGVRALLPDARWHLQGRLLDRTEHAAVELHGYLAYIVSCAVSGRPYTIYGYKGKQVRDQIHSRDVARLFLEFYKTPRCGEVYNLGGGRKNSLSILETIELLRDGAQTAVFLQSGKPNRRPYLLYLRFDQDSDALSAMAPGIRPQQDITGDCPALRLPSHMSF